MLIGPAGVGGKVGGGELVGEGVRIVGDGAMVGEGIGEAQATKVTPIRTRRASDLYDILTPGWLRD
jgi:hypothetical protein